MEKSKNEKLEVIRLVLDFLRSFPAEKLTLDDLAQGLGEESHLLLITVLVLPYLQPIPVPGLSTVSGTLLALLAVMAMIHRPPWIPKRYRHFSFSKDKLISICEKSSRWSRWLNRITRPRMAQMRGPIMHQIIFALIILAGLELALPLPIPGTNTLPSINILFFTVGLLEKDGLLVLLGIITAIISAAVFAAILILPFLGIRLFQT